MDLEHTLRSRDPTGMGNWYTGWHDEQIFCVAPSQRHWLYRPVEDGFTEGWECDMILCIPSSISHIYFSHLTVDAANQSIKAAQTMKGWGPEAVEVIMSIHGLARGQFAHFEIVCLVHTVLYGVAYRGFVDPVLYDVGAEYVCLLAPLSDNVCRMTDFWG